MKFYKENQIHFSLNYPDDISQINAFTKYPLKNFTKMYILFCHTNTMRMWFLKDEDNFLQFYLAIKFRHQISPFQCVSKCSTDRAILITIFSSSNWLILKHVSERVDVTVIGRHSLGNRRKIICNNRRRSYETTIEHIYMCFCKQQSRRTVNNSERTQIHPPRILTI